MAERLEAYFENRTYYFTLEAKGADFFEINMYSTVYRLKKQVDLWINFDNKMNLSNGLIEAVIYTLTRPE